MSKKRYITIQIIPDDSSQTWTLKLRYRFFEFLFYAVIIALFAVALAAVKITEINGKVLTATHLAQANRELMRKQEKMALLEQELSRVADQERRIRDIVQTFLSEPGTDSLPAEDLERPSRFTPGDLDRYLLAVRAIEKRTRPRIPGGARDWVPDIWPVHGIISQAFSGESSAESRHEGLDIIAESNALVLSAAKGIVVEAGWDRDLGKFIRIDHDFGVQTVYGHLSRSFVEAGDHVEKGTSIGTVGNTGYSFGPHLHYEIMVRDKFVDPQHYLK